MPLSPYSLLLVVTGEYEQIRITWNGISGIDKYNIWRSEGKNSAFKVIKHAIEDTVYVDKSVKYGKTYFYKIQPFLTFSKKGIEDAIKSSSVSAKTILFPVKKLVSKSSIGINDGRGIAIDGNYAYIADGKGGLKIIDISDPDNFAEVGSLKTQNALGIAVKSPYAFIADGSRGIRVIDITEPDSPEFFGLRKTTNAQKIVLKGNFAFVADGPGGVKIIDVSKAPLLLSEFFTGGHTYKIALKGNLAFAASGKAGINVIDVHDASNPVPVSIFNSRDSRDIAVQNSIIYKADGSAGVKIIDASDPEKLKTIASLEIPDAVSVSVSGNYIFTAGSKGLYVNNISDPKNPVQTDFYKIDYAMSITTEGKYIYLSEDYRGLKVFAFSEKKGRITLVSCCKTVYAISADVKQLCIRSRLIWLACYKNTYPAVAKR